MRETHVEVADVENAGFGDKGGADRALECGNEDVVGLHEYAGQCKR